MAVIGKICGWERLLYLRHVCGYTLKPCCVMNRNPRIEYLNRRSLSFMESVTWSAKKFSKDLSVIRTHHFQDGRKWVGGLGMRHWYSMRGSMGTVVVLGTLAVESEHRRHRYKNRDVPQSYKPGNCGRLQCCFWWIEHAKGGPVEIACRGPDALRNPWEPCQHVTRRCIVYPYLLPLHLREGNPCQKWETERRVRFWNVPWPQGIPGWSRRDWNF